VTLQRGGGAAAFSSSADAYAATMAPALRPVAAEVVRRADLRTGERVLDLGTGTGTAAALARGDGRRITGVDAAAGMLDVARREVPDVEFVESDFASLPMAPGSADVVLAVHALLFADDRVGTLRAWLEATRPGGRLSMSVPGPGDVVPTAVLGDVYRRFGLMWGDDYPTAADIAAWADEAGWTDVGTAADPTVAIRLANDDLYRTWLRVGSRGRATADWSEARCERFAAELMAASPRDADGAYVLPFGALYLTARRAPDA
jgi:SAM-dependent methyltransferase